MSELPPALRARIDEVVRRADLAGVIGRTVKLRKVGREFSGLCPFHQEKTGSFTVVPEKRWAHCFGCGWHGDALKFVQDAHGLPFKDALADLEAECGIGPATERRARREAPAPVPVQRESVRRGDRNGLVSSIEAGIAIWREGRGASGSLVERYLESRRLAPRRFGLLTVLRYHPRCPVSLWRTWEGPGDARLTAPAMLAPICRVEGQPGGRFFVQQGVHVTFLAPDGSGKAKLPPWQDRETGKWHERPSRKIFGDAGMGCVPIPPALWEADNWGDAEWIGAPHRAPGSELVVGEGMESTHSLLERVAGACGGVATLSLGNLQGGYLDDGPKVEGRRAMKLWDLRPDPDSTVFTVPDAGPVVIGIDADMKGLGERWVQERPRERPVRRAISGAERSTICGQLASGHWRAAGARPVRVMRPPMGQDFNDVARGEK